MTESKEYIESCISSFKQKGIVFLKEMSEEELTNIIKLSNERYYNESPVITDYQFDIIKEFTEQKFPNNISISGIGADVERNKVKLPYEMASMNKIKADTNALSSWCKKYNGPYLLSCKLDGVSGLYTTINGSRKLYTRGNGVVGQDISHLIPYMNLPKNEGLVIRGEFIIPKLIFEEKFKSFFANPRNMVAGIINKKQISQYISDVCFVGYEVIVPILSPREQIECLNKIKMEHVSFKYINNLSNEYLSKLLIYWRQNYLYEIDGVIVTDDKTYLRKHGNPEHSFAFKMVLSEQIAESTVVDVIWTASKDGYLKPRVQIMPVHLGGVKIEFTTGFNGSFIYDNKIGIGTIVEIIRSGDVIPYIKSIIVPSEEPKMPSVPYKWNSSFVDIMVEDLMDNKTVKGKNITGFFQGIGVEGLSFGNINRIMNYGYDSVPSIINMSETDFLQIDGFKEKMANKLYTGIREKLEKTNIVTIMSASNIFGRGFSEKRFELIMSEFPDMLVSKVELEEKINQISTIKGMSRKSAELFVCKIKNFISFVDECGLKYKLNEIKIKTKSYINNELTGKTIVLTGTRDKKIVEYIKSVGAKQSSNVGKNTFLVVANITGEDTVKCYEAKKYNIPIVSINEFINKFMI